MSLRQMQLEIIAISWLASCLAIAGCTGDSKHGTVSGTVTLDGQPLVKGTISFIPTTGDTSSADALIVDGKFSQVVPVGEKRVTISSSKVTGKRKAYDTPDSPTIDITEEALPRQYNAESKLTLSVEPGKQTSDYELKSGK
jgi:hypothetical protein